MGHLTRTAGGERDLLLGVGFRFSWIDGETPLAWDIFASVNL